MKRTLPALVAALVTLVAIPACAPNPLETDSITVARAQFESVALVYVAQDQGMFADNGLAVTYREHATGFDALNAVLNDEADIAVGTAEFPLVVKAFEGAPVSAIAIIDRPDFIYVVGRKDRGIEGPSDLRGKRVGTVAGSVAQFYLGRFLELNGMTAEDITFVDLRTPEQWRAAIASGDVDAVVLAQPEATLVSNDLGNNATFFSVQQSQPAFALAISKNEWIEDNPEIARKFLSALAQAEEFVARNPAETRAIIQNRLSLDPSYMDSVWAQNTFALSLDESLKLAMEDEARWMMRNQITTETVLPDFGNYVHADALEAVKPGAVNILP